MFLSLRDFDFMFPNYYEYKTPMWSDWKETSSEAVLSIAVPGYEKENFELFMEENKLFLRINSEKHQLLYSILGSLEFKRYEADRASAEYRSGILKITLPKVEKDKKKTIIKVS